MYYLKQGAKYLALALLLVLVFSIAAAGNTSSVDYILYERSDGNYILVNYEEALDLYNSGSLSQKKLYQKTVEDVQVALANFRDVYVSTTIGGDTVVLDYSEAVNDGKTFSQAVDNHNDYKADTKYNSVAKLYNEAYREMVLVGNTVALRRPAQDEVPDGIEIYAVYSELAKSWFINVKINETESALTLSKVDAVEIFGRGATRGDIDDGSRIWRIRMSDSGFDRLDVDENNLTTRHFRVMHDGRWLW